MVRVELLRQGGWRRFGVMLALCALLFRVAIPTGWMPQANAAGVSLGWCDGISHAVPAEAKALLDEALSTLKHKPVKPAPEQPCAFAAAAQALDAPPLILVSIPRAAPQPLPYPALRSIPGRGLAAPPPLSTGPPILA
jgi:hypothetical protein